MIAKIWKKYKEFILYLFFGVCTTIINIAAYIVLRKIAGINTIFSTGIAWFVSVLFAYGTNRTWVFDSKTKGRALVGEAAAFVVCRILSGLMDVVVMWLCVDVMGYNDMIMKIIANVIVVIVNFVVSKGIVFKG